MKQNWVGEGKERINSKHSKRHFLHQEVKWVILNLKKKKKNVFSFVEILLFYGCICTLFSSSYIGGKIRGDEVFVVSTELDKFRNKKYIESQMEFTLMICC